MSSIVEEYVLYDLTKKERVAYIAKKDPFLKVERIAQLAETTPHYVRTVLSEANLSLTRLRKEYAQGTKGDVGQNMLFLDVLDAQDLGDLNLVLLNKIVLNNINEYQEVVAEEQYILERSILFEEKESPLMINTTFIVGCSDLKDIHQIKGRKNVVVSEPRIKIESANSQIAEVLNLEETKCILALEKKLFINEELKGLDLIYFSPKETALEIEQSNKLKLVKATG